MTEEAEEGTEEVTVTDEAIAEWAESESESLPSSDEQTIDALLDEWDDTSDHSDDSGDSDEEWGEDTFTEEPQQTLEEQLIAEGAAQQRNQDLETWANSVNQELGQQKAEFQTYRDRRDLDIAISETKQILDRPDLTDSYVKTWLIDHAKTDPALDRDWENRHQNPAQWDYTLQKAVNRLGKQLPQLPVDDKDDRVAAAAFVRGSSTRDTPKPEVKASDLANLSDAEFDQYQSSIGINP